MNIFRSSTPENSEAKKMAVRPQMSETHLKNIRTNAKAFYEQCGGKGTLTLEQLENHAIISAWNTVVAADAAEAGLPVEAPAKQPVLELKRAAG